MANRWKGNIIAAAATTSSGTDYTGKANGSWSLNNQLQQKQGNLWAKGVGLPSAPTIGTVVSSTINQATIPFTPADTGGFPITQYIATSNPGNITATSTGSPITITGLTSGVSYTFTVVARTSAGDSSPSAPSNSIVPYSGPQIGQAMGGGFYAGSISTTGNGVATHYLIVAPKATGEVFGKLFGPMGGVTVGASSVIDGPSNSAKGLAGGTQYEAATFCEGLTIGGYSDWYLPAKNELEVLYYFLKPTTDANNTSVGSNANAVTPEPISTAYTTTSPTQTVAGIGFRTGETNSFITSPPNYWSSTEAGGSYTWVKNFISGYETDSGKNNANVSTRAVRRVAI